MVQWLETGMREDPTSQLQLKIQIQYENLKMGFRFCSAFKFTLGSRSVLQIASLALDISKKNSEIKLKIDDI